MERLQKVLARAGVASRRAAEQLIREGRVRVDGAVVTEQGVRVDAERSRITVDGRPVSSRVRHRYVVLNKPLATVSTMKDPQGRRTVAQLFEDVPERLVPVGRLDYHTTGVLLLTNDGELAAQLTHPSYGSKKVYRLEVRGAIDARVLARLRQSIVIDGRATQPAEVTLEGTSQRSSVLRVLLREGRNRQIRRLADRAGLEVVGLERVEFAGVTARGLGPGQWRELTPGEVRRLKSR